MHQPLRNRMDEVLTRYAREDVREDLTIYEMREEARKRASARLAELENKMNEKIVYKLPVKGKTYTAIENYIAAMRTLKAQTESSPEGHKPLHREFAKALEVQIAQAETLAQLLKL